MSRFVVAVLASALVAAGISGCATGSGISAGEHVTVYVSAPQRGPGAADGRDVIDGAKLALANAGGKVGELRVRAVYLDDTGGRGPRARWTPAAAAANARRAIEDSTAIAYLGDFDSGATRSSLPITNQAHLLQVSPASAAIDLMQPFLGAGDQVPDVVQPTGDRTFGRVIPSDEVQGEAGAVWAKRLGLKRPSVSPCSSAYSQVVRAAFVSEARNLGLDVAKPGTAIDLEYVPSDGSNDCFAIHHVGAPVMATDALLPQTGQSPTPGGTFFATSAAEDPSQLPPAGQRFVRAFRDRYGRAPGRYAAYGYEAMAVVLDAIRRAGDSGDDRDSVVNAFFDTENRHSVVGTYSIDELGNTTLRRLAGYRIVNGRPVFSAELRVP